VVDIVCATVCRRAVRKWAHASAGPDIHVREQLSAVLED